MLAQDGGPLPVLRKDKLLAERGLDDDLLVEYRVPKGDVVGMKKESS